jgi:hypothetical protein
MNEQATESRNCNACGETVSEGERCPRHPNERVHVTALETEPSQLARVGAPKLILDEQTGKTKSRFRVA